jgi:hypothetical protein
LLKVSNVSTQTAAAIFKLDICAADGGSESPYKDLTVVAEWKVTDVIG